MTDKNTEQHKKKSLQHSVTATPSGSDMDQANPITRNAASAPDYDNADNIDNVDNVDLVDITDDYMFSTVMQDPELCRELLERLLPRCKIKRVSIVPLEDDVVGSGDVGEIAAKELTSTTSLTGQAPLDASQPTAFMLPEIQKTMTLLLRRTENPHGRLSGG